MSPTSTLTKLPRTIDVGSARLELARLNAAHKDALLAFARSLSERDLLFLRMDITDPAVVDKWIDSQADDHRVTLLALQGQEVVGYGSLNRRDLAWFRHLGEIRVIVGERCRRQGLGRRLAHEIFEIARGLGLTKVVAQMAREQEGARRTFEQLGFHAEALLTDWVIDQKGRTHDLLILSHDVSGLG